MNDLSSATITTLDSIGSELTGAIGGGAGLLAGEFVSFEASPVANELIGYGIQAGATATADIVAGKSGSSTFTDLLSSVGSSAVADGIIKTPDLRSFAVPGSIKAVND